MPNKRDPNKVKLSFYVPRQLKDEAKEVLEEIGTNFTEFFTYQIYKLTKDKIDEIKTEMRQLDGRTKEGKARIKKQKNATCD